MTKYRVTYVTDLESIADVIADLTFPVSPAGYSLDDGRNLSHVSEVWIEEVQE